MMIYQKTIKNPISCSGIGLHSGQKVRLSLKPAAVDTGIVFKRVDLPEQPVIHAKVSNIINVNYATSLCRDNIQVQTVEHLLAALSGLGIDNLIIELDAVEVPIMDGSAAPFVYLLHEAGIRELNLPKTYIRVNEDIEVKSQDKSVKISPADEFCISYNLDFNHHLLRGQKATLNFSEEIFTQKISRARTFGFIDEIMELRKNGLAKGGSLDNAIVIGRYHILNDGLRFSDEFVHHKIMDLIGDLYLVGYPIIGHVSAYKAGHHLHNELAGKILAQSDKWEFITDLEPVKKKAAFYPSSWANTSRWRRASL